MIICAACGNEHANCEMLGLMGGGASLPIIERDVPLAERIGYVSPETVTATPPEDVLPRGTDWNTTQG